MQAGMPRTEQVRHIPECCCTADVGMEEEEKEEEEDEEFRAGSGSLAQK